MFVIGFLSYAYVVLNIHDRNTQSSGLEQKCETTDKEPKLKDLPCEECSLLANDDVKMS